MGLSGIKVCLITIELIRDAIAEWKQEKQIFSQEITQTNCIELTLSFPKILQISNLENIINVIFTFRQQYDNENRKFRKIKKY